MLGTVVKHLSCHSFLFAKASADISDGQLGSQKWATLGCDAIRPVIRKQNRGWLQRRSARCYHRPEFVRGRFPHIFQRLRDILDLPICLVSVTKLVTADYAIREHPNLAFAGARKRGQGRDHCRKSFAPQTLICKYLLQAALLSDAVRSRCCDPFRSSVTRVPRRTRLRRHSAIRSLGAKEKQKHQRK